MMKSSSVAPVADLRKHHMQRLHESTYQILDDLETQIRGLVRLNIPAVEKSDLRELAGMVAAIDGAIRQIGP